MEKEIWKSVIGFEEGYEISNFGRLKSKKRLVDYGWKQCIRPSKILSFRKGKYGYLYTVISINKIRKTVKAHRLVAITFLPNPLNLPDINHKDGNKSNNYLSNLEWCNKSHNIKHAYKLGLKKSKKGQDSHLSKINKNIVDIIRFEYRNKKYSQNKLAIKYNISQSQINRIVNFKNWS